MTARDAILSRLGGTMTPSAIADEAAALLVAPERPPVAMTALEETFYAGQRPLAYDGCGRITLPESLCQDAGLGEDVVIVGLGPRFQIWDRARWNARRDARRALARQVMLGDDANGQGA